MILIGVFLIIIIIFIYSSLRIASISDEDIEKNKND